MSEIQKLTKDDTAMNEQKIDVTNIHTKHLKQNHRQQQ